MQILQFFIFYSTKKFKIIPNKYKNEILIPN